MTSDADIWDAVVIGAGPAGGLAACLLARRGLRVALLERACLPRVKVCGGCLNARGVAILEACGLGYAVGVEAATPLAIIEFRNGRQRVELRGQFGVAVDRARMDQAIVDSAQRAGAVVIDGVHARVLPDNGRQWREVSVNGANLHHATWRARVIVAADGLGRPSLASLSDFSSTPVVGSRIGFGVTSALAPPSADEYPAGQLHMAVRSDGYAGVTRLIDGRLCIAAAIDPRVARQGERLGSWLANVVAACGWPELPGLESAKIRGTPLLTRFERRLAGRRLLLVGDAAGYTEPITGEGMAWALAGAAALPDVVVGGLHNWTSADERLWEQTLNAMVFRRMKLNRFLTTTLRRPALSRAVFAAASLFPSGASALARQLNRSRQQLGRVA